ncbi:hypothetical protein SLNWT_2026 [Streptomyces albus]|uniref:Uncharacterized protein n=1 Tax=Streptomyces albus (strain ATCC 21838 / DSM 41398 / FERM P-419 / JCM 4703 / NBRC 107858) TaxID=1081613 RepID=A0A0B5EWE1_STRA4|nr:hypothetical protein SLNWT_2026 [Streptomyces albus]AOU76716.1 hypothetical protein SLNHY_2025 [Streptomyces albus]AYN32496.1 hypothetical protein DUI70_1993 [Streptomyces albus]
MTQDHHLTGAHPCAVADQHLVPLVQGRHHRRALHLGEPEQRPDLVPFRCLRHQKSSRSLRTPRRLLPDPGLQCHRLSS